MVVNDLDVNLTDEVLHQLDLEDALTSEFCQFSLNVVTGTDHGQALKLRALVQNKVMLILVDSGSSHSFVSASFLAACGIQSVSMAPKQVRVANGETLVTDNQVFQLSWWIQRRHSFCNDMMVLDLCAFDAILGFDWLSPHSPMTYHWEHKTIQFCHKNSLVKLQGIVPQSSNLHSITSLQLAKWVKGNDVETMAIVEMLDFVPSSQPPTPIHNILLEYVEVFTEPTSLPPPHRFHDHHIPLIPNAIHVNSRPYTIQVLPTPQKWSGLLASGKIVPSNNPFASHVLPVQKKDGTWRFCVDYRKLSKVSIE